MKRFTETNKWDDPWFRKLNPETKLLWIWLLDRCDNAGIIDFDLELASFHVRYQYPLDTLLEIGERVMLLPCGKYFIPKFIPFQYGNISVDCKAHNPVFQSLKKHGLEGYSKGIQSLQEEEKVKDKEKATEKGTEKVKDKEPGEKDSHIQDPPPDDRDNHPEKSAKPPCTLEQAKSYAPNVKMTATQAEHWWHTRNASGWTKGSTGGGAPRKITSWQSDMATSLSWVGESLEKSKHAGSGGKKREFSSSDVGI